MTNERLEQAIALLSTNKHEPLDFETLIGLALEGKRPHGHAVMRAALVAARRIAELEAIIDEQRAAGEAQVARVADEWRQLWNEQAAEIGGFTAQLEEARELASQWRPWVVSLIHHEDAPASAYLDGTSDEDLRRLVAGELARRVRAANELIASLPAGSTVIGYEGGADEEPDGTQWIVHVWTSEPPFPGESDPLLGKPAELPPEGAVRLLPWCYRFEKDGETTEQGRAATWGDVFEALYGEIDAPKPGDECVIVFATPEDMLEADSDGYLTDEALSDLLSLVMDGHHPSPEQVSMWTPEERAEAEAWASAEHLVASDHTDVERLPRPAWLPDPAVVTASTPTTAQLEELAALEAGG